MTELLNLRKDFMNNGFVSLHRKLLDWEWYQDSITKCLFIHLLLTANFTEKNWRGITVKRGQVLIGRLKLAESLGFSEQQIRTALNKLKSTKELTIKTTNKYSLVTVLNYDTYQQVNQQTNQRVTNNQPTTNQQLTTTNKDNKDNKDNKRERTTLTKVEYSSFKDLINEVIQEIAKYYEVPFEFVLEKKEDMDIWMGKSKKNKYANYKKALMKWVRDDKRKLVSNNQNKNRGGVLDARDL